VQGKFFPIQRFFTAAFPVAQSICLCYTSFRGIVAMNTVVNYLKQSDIFYQFTPTQLEMIANLCQEVTFQEGEIVFRENSSSKELYIITHGEIEILINPSTIAPASVKNDQIDSVIAILRRGQSFGEVALVDEGLRSASARALHKETRLLVISRDKVIMLCETYPQLGYRLMYNLAADLAMKIRNTDLRIREQLLYKPQ
jgi:CRP/FNR family cyclic AMP-dependent transcriptional regulator